MKSKTSFFNRGIAKNLLHRCWPLWAGYLVLLLLTMPLMLQQHILHNTGYVGSAPMLDQTVVGMGVWMLLLSFAVCILVVMAMYAYLYNNRSCGMMNALPVTRTTMFFTAWLTGFVPLLLSDLVAAALCLPFAAAGYLSLRALGALLVIMFAGKLCFYGFAVLCAMLTGSLIILPMVYAVLNFTAYVAEMATRYVMSKVIFGLHPDVSFLSWLSPLVQMIETCNVMPEGEELVLRGLGAIAAYGAAGLALTLLAWRLYLRRQMETATDTVAISILKPVFKYCMAYGCGVLLAAFFHSAILLNRTPGLPNAVLTALIVLLGSLVGYFAAEMLIRKTVWVFRGSWSGWLIFAAAAVLVIGVCECDLFGWEKHQPKAEHIVSATVEDTVYEEPESIREILALQRSVVANKKHHEIVTPVGRSATGSIRLIYCLDDGRKLTRYYSIYGDDADLRDPDSDIAKLQSVMNLPEALRFRSLSKVPVTEENVMNFEASYSYYTPEQDSWSSEDVRFDAADAVDFYENALLPDLAENRIGRRFFWEDAAPRGTNVTIWLQFTDGAALAAGYFRTEATSRYCIDLCEDNTYCLDWLQAHCGLEIRIEENEPQNVPLRYHTAGRG